ncbi:MAG: N-acetylmuramoyl-L-alanine amidase [Lachnospiraceae bacterium]|nr:N-acetylmuramoyl-L-alanine amidase [Lachnospiraceae bacterium]
MMRQKMKRALYGMTILLLLFTLVPAVPSYAAGRAQDVGDSLVVVIDAGHGGENLGAKDYGPLEKDLTLTTAKAMYEELLKYDGVTVFMTRTDDTDLSLEQRAQFAADMGADFLFSIHYNASESHKRYGSEVLVSTQAPYNAYGYQFGSIALSNLTSMGLYNRGVKAKEGNQGDYYGLMREASKRKVPSCIIEHCYLDMDSDKAYADSTEDLQAFGRMDAKSVAQYFGLKSTTLGVDYSGTTYPEVNASKVVPVTKSDGDGPDTLEISLWNNNPSTGDVTVAVHGFDANAAILYYEYSLDGGITYTPFYKWPNADALNNNNDNDFTINFQMPDGASAAFIVRAYNIFDEVTASNLLDLNTQVLATEYQQGKAVTPVVNTEPVVTETPTTDWSPSNATYENADDPSTWSEDAKTSTPTTQPQTGKKTTNVWIPVLILAGISLIIVLLLVLVIRLVLLEHRR